jgi:hypothetical protein
MALPRSSHSRRRKTKATNKIIKLSRDDGNDDELTQAQLMAASDNILRSARIARLEANRNFDRDTWRTEMSDRAMERKGIRAWNWQLDILEAVEYKLDILSIAATGKGKTMQFLMPLLAHPEKHKKIWIVSPLKDLQFEQVCVMHIIDQADSISIHSQFRVFQ